VNKLKTVDRIITASGGWDDRDLYIKLHSPPYMDLVIERVGESPNGLPLISVAHYFEQNGDLCQDPEMLFEVSDLGWRPVFFQQAIPPIYREAVIWNGGSEFIDQRVMRDLTSFARTWDRNIRHQGFEEVVADQVRQDRRSLEKRPA
jgi:hypothetical protein